MEASVVTSEEEEEVSAGWYFVVLLAVGVCRHAPSKTTPQINPATTSAVSYTHLTLPTN
jgi:hypothetical protein